MSMLNHKIMLRGLNCPLVQKVIWAEYENMKLLAKAHKLNDSMAIIMDKNKCIFTSEVSSSVKNVGEDYVIVARFNKDSVGDIKHSINLAIQHLKSAIKIKEMLL